MLVAFAAGVVATAFPTLGQGYAFIKIAETAPGGFASFSNVAPSVNASGTVVFQSGFAGVAGIYTGAGGATTTIADTNDPIFLSFGGGPVSINAAGTASFRANRKAEAGGGSGIFTVSGGEATNIALSGASGGGVFTGFGSDTSINIAGTVAFYATRNADVGGGDGIYTGNGGPVAPVAQSTDPDITGFGGGFAPMINAAGTVVFTAGIEGTPGSNSAIFARNGGSSTEIARNSPGVLGTFSNFGVPSINFVGEVAFSAGLQDLNRGVYVGSGGGPTNIIDSGNPGAPTTLIDTTGPFSNGASFNPSINTAGTVVFAAALDAGGLGLFTGPDPVADKVIRTGDLLFGSTINNLIFGNQGFNDAGQIAFLYFLDNGRSGIALTAAGLPGDYNQNNIVDAADYTVWRDNLGSGTALPNDDTPGVDANDYTRWKTHFGEVAGSGSGSGATGSASAAVPEPAPLVLVALGGLLATFVFVRHNQETT